MIYPVKRILVCLLALLTSGLYAQDALPYDEDIATIRAYDNIYQIPAHPIVFVGSSSIRKWETLQIEFGDYNVLNRGIGGAVVNDIIANLNDLVFKYEPRQLVIYVGENDLPDEHTTADSVLNRTKRLFSLIREKLPTVPILYISPKPSPSRDQYMSKAMAANKLIRGYLALQKDCTYIDIYTPMLKGGKSRPELFIEDQLHLNRTGYRLWEKAIRKHLLKPVSY